MRLPQAGEVWTPKVHNLNVPVHGLDPKGRKTVVIKPGQPIRIIEVLGPPGGGRPAATPRAVPSRAGALAGRNKNTSSEIAVLTGVELTCPPGGGPARVARRGWAGGGTQAHTQAQTSTHMHIHLRL